MTRRTLVLATLVTVTAAGVATAAHSGTPSRPASAGAARDAAPPRILAAGAVPSRPWSLVPAVGGEVTTGFVGRVSQAPASHAARGAAPPRILASGAVPSRPWSLVPAVGGEVTTGFVGRVSQAPASHAAPPRILVGGIVPPRPAPAGAAAPPRIVTTGIMPPRRVVVGNAARAAVPQAFTAGALPGVAPRGPAATPPVAGAPCVVPEVTPSTSTAAPSARLLDALAVLRRPRTPEDTVPPEALRNAFVGGVMADAARRVADGTWLVPVASVYSPPQLPAQCLPPGPPPKPQPPVEGVIVIKGSVPTERFATELILEGRAFSIQGCTGSMHDRLTVQGVVPDGASPVTLTARDGTILQAVPEDNLVRFDLARPQSKAGLPAHIGAGRLQYKLDPRTTNGLEQPCEPPTRNSIGRRREPPTRLQSPKGARIELETARWQPEDSGPRIAGATYRRAGRRCLLLAPERRLRDGGRAHRFCVDDDRLRAERFVARATRVGDYVVLEGFVDREKVSAVVVERSLRPGAHRLATARESGAFFMAVRGTFAAGGTFKIHAALRGKPVRYTGLRDVRLSPRRGG